MYIEPEMSICVFPALTFYRCPDRRVTRVVVACVFLLFVAFLGVCVRGVMVVVCGGCGVIVVLRRFRVRRAISSLGFAFLVAVAFRCMRFCVRFVCGIGIFMASLRVSNSCRSHARRTVPSTSVPIS